MRNNPIMHRDVLLRFQRHHKTTWIRTLRYAIHRANGLSRNQALCKCGLAV